MSGGSTPLTELMDKGVNVGMVLIVLIIVIFEATRLYFRLGVTFEVYVPLPPLLVFWNVLINLYLVYHRVTLPLPAWLTFGHPVAYGGMKSNVCSGPEASGTWPCFPPDLAAWYAEITGIQGWKHFLQPPAKLLFCLLHLAISIGLLVLLVAVVLRPGLLHKRIERNEQRRRRERERAYRERYTQCTGIELVELVDSEKQ